MAMNYGNGTNSTIGRQLVPFYYYKKALIDLKKEQYFGQLASTIGMPKHMGKSIKRYHYVPMLDDRNINDQGIDATGNVIDFTKFKVTFTNKVFTFAVEADATAAAAAVNTVESGVAVKTGSSTPWTVTIGKNNLADLATEAEATAIKTIFGDDVTALPLSGNLYGSSKDVGTITSKLPVLGENGGRVNRVGFTRVEIVGQIENYGFFMEFTEDSMNFDTDAELLSNITREAVRGANEIVEDLLQIDLLNGAGVVLYGGDATSVGEVTGNDGDTASVLTYDLLERESTILDNNRCPKDTEIISGSRMTDTKVIGSARYSYIGSELKRTLLKMVDYHNDKAFIPVQHYADAGTIARGEIGCVGNRRFILVPEMACWEGAGATVTTNDGYREVDGKYNVYPVLTVGSGSFSTIGFQTDGKTVKFKTFVKKPGLETADRSDPFGKKGFYSTQWWYGTMIYRPEWISVIKVVAEQ